MSPSQVMPFTPSLVLLRAQTDERLVALARGGSEAAFTAIVERHRRTMLGASRRVLPEARAEDAVQQAFVAAWKALRRGDEVRDLRAWLLRITRNTSLNALRLPGYDAAELHESLSIGEAPQAELERREIVRRTLAGLAALPERQREALLRSAVAGDPHADIARDLGMSEGAARQLVLRARSRLRSAATALTPMPLLQWSASAADPSLARVAEIAAGAGGAGAAAGLAKAGAVLVVAGGAVATPVVVDRASEPARAKPPVLSAAGPERPRATPPVVTDRIAAGDEQDGEDRSARRGGEHDDDDRSGRRGGRERDDREDRSGRRGGRERDDDDDRSGPGDGRERDGRDDRSGRRGGEEPDDDRSGPGGGEERDDPAEAAEEQQEAEQDAAKELADAAEGDRSGSSKSSDSESSSGGGGDRDAEPEPEPGED